LSYSIHDDRSLDKGRSMDDDIQLYNPSTSDNGGSSNKKKINSRKIVLSSLIGLVMMQQQPSFGVTDKAGLSSSALEQSVVKLETATNRAGLIDKLSMPLWNSMVMVCLGASIKINSPSTLIYISPFCTTCADTIQALADVFEAAGSKTLLARTKFKYVR